MGDSITDVWGRGNNGSVFFPGKPYVNRGISGQTTAQMLLRFYPDVVALKPKAVVILAGTNDIGGNLGPVAWNPSSRTWRPWPIIARANNIKVVLSSLTPVCDYHRPQTATRPPEKILRAQPLDQGLCRQPPFGVPGLLLRHRRRQGILQSRDHQRRPASQRGRIRNHGTVGREGHRRGARDAGSVHRIRRCRLATIGRRGFLEGMLAAGGMAAAAARPWRSSGQCRGAGTCCPPMPARRITAR